MVDKNIDEEIPYVDDVENQLIDNEDLLVEDEEVNTDESIVDLYHEQHTRPSEVSTFVDVTKGSVIDKSELSHFDVIKAIASKTGMAIRDPKSSCKKCYGRGYIGIDILSKSPIACNCIYPPKTQNEKESEKYIEDNNFNVLSRRVKRNLKAIMKRDKKKTIKNKFNDKMNQIAKNRVKVTETI